MNMYPMDFEEFLWAIGKEASFDFIKNCYENLQPLGESINRAVMRDFRLYMLVGGMPQAINAYLDSNDFAVVDRKKEK